MRISLSISLGVLALVLWTAGCKDDPPASNPPAEDIFVLDDSTANGDAPNGPDEGPAGETTTTGQDAVETGDVGEATGGSCWSPTQTETDESFDCGAICAHGDTCPGATQGCGARCAELGLHLKGTVSDALGTCMASAPCGELEGDADTADRLFALCVQTLQADGVLVAKEGGSQVCNDLTTKADECSGDDASVGFCPSWSLTFIDEVMNRLGDCASAECSEFDLCLEQVSCLTKTVDKTPTGCWTPDTNSGLDCGSICAKVNECVEEPSCEASCEKVAPYLKNDAVAPLESCIDMLGCTFSVGSEAFLGCAIQYAQESGSTAGTTCMQLSARGDTCGGPGLGPVVEICQALGPMFTAEALAQLQACSQVPCEELDSCIVAANCFFLETISGGR